MSGRTGRATFSSRWGAVLATSGVAIGLGNVWRFPYMMGKFGGIAFLALYLLIVFLFAVPALWAEWALGRMTRRGPLGALQAAGLPGGRWWGRLLLLTVTMAGSYYGVVLAWVLFYAASFAYHATVPGAPPSFEALSGRVGVQMICVAATVGLGCGALYLGVKNGIERLSRVILPLFFALLTLLILRVLTLEGAAAGLREYLVPRWDAFSPSTALAALGQTFFSMGLGGTFMVIYGSYLRSEEDIPATAVYTALADTSAALMAGLIVVPAALALKVSLRSGPGLMFVTLPDVFDHLPAGNLLGAVFFFSIFLVAMLSLMAAYEVLVGELVDDLGWSRGRALALVGASQLVLAVPAVLSGSYVAASDLIWGSTMQPLGGMIAVVALTWCLGQGRALDEIRRNSRLPVPRWLYYWIKFALPLGILTILIYGWLEQLSG